MQMSKILLTASALALLSVPAIAGNSEGLYIEGHGGWSSTNDHPTKTATTRDNPTEYDNGWNGGGALGYSFGNGIRTELEATYRDNGFDKVGGTGNLGGDLTSWAFMANALYDFDVLGNSKLLPYLGAGVGAVHSRFDGRGFAFGAVDDHDWNFAYQGIAGVQYNLDYNWGVFADYRYLSVLNTKYEGPAATGGVNTDYNNNSVMLGLRYTFGGPTQTAAAEPAPMAPAPAPMAAPVAHEEGAVSRKYLVFFDFNKATLTPEAIDVLKQAASDATSGKAVAVEVTGHTDTSGSASYNQKLSAKRAAAVKAELTKLGISGKEITTLAKGESDPLVPTGDGVKEPQNRRAEITYVIKSQR